MLADLFEKGARAPAFDLPSSSGGRVSNADLAGQAYVLVFYPGDFTPVCTSELALFEQARGEIEAAGARLFGVSVDSLSSHMDFARAQNLGFALLADDQPKGAASTAFRSYNAEKSRSLRSLFVVDADGGIFWSYLSPDGVNPGVDGVLRALKDLGSDETTARKPQGDFHTRGRADAAVTLTEYGDYQCPYCADAYQELKQVFTHFGDSLRFEFRNFPLSNVHPYAEMAAEAAEAAGAQGKFWEMHDGLYENQQSLSPELVIELANSLGLDVRRIAKEVDDHAYLPRIRADISDGLHAGVNGTPSFFINGRLHQQGFDAQSLIAAIGKAAR